jgi:hypothetical protein
VSHINLFTDVSLYSLRLHTRSVTDPYLKFFRKRIPKVGGFDISALPAIFILDIVGQATAALGAELPIEKKIPKANSLNQFMKSKFRKHENSAKLCVEPFSRSN